MAVTAADMKEIWERLSGVEANVKNIAAGQTVIFEKLDGLAERKIECPMGASAHNDVIQKVKDVEGQVCKVETRVESLEQSRAADRAQRKTLYLVIIGSLTLGGIVWGMLTWALDHLSH